MFIQLGLLATTILGGHVPQCAVLLEHTQFAFGNLAISLPCVTFFLLCLIHMHLSETQNHALPQLDDLKVHLMFFGIHKTM